MMAIEMTGGVYCPLSPRDPLHRLHALLQQTQSRVVLTHFLTKTKFNDGIILLDIDSTMIDGNMQHDVNVDLLSSLIVASDAMAYIVFTSGSLGTPKAVSSKEHY